MFESSVIDAYEFLSCPRVKRWISKSYSHETHELSLNKNTAVDHSGNNTVLRIKGM